MTPGESTGESPKESTAALAGIRVLDTSTGIAGPYAAMFLADHGADVIKIEPPGGDPLRGQSGFYVFNRGKRSAVLDLEQAADVRRLLGLARHSDVFITDRPQATLRQIGLGYAVLHDLQPRLIYLAVTPFGERGPLVERPSSPGMVAAVSGIMSAQASYDGAPVMPVIPAASYGAGVLGAAAVAAGLYARERDGVGRMLEVSELAGGLAMQLGTVTSDLISDAQLQSPLLGPRGPVPPYALFEAARGEWFFLACGTHEFFDRMLVAIDRPELAADRRLAHAPWGLTTVESGEALTPVLEELFRTRPREHWIALFRDADVPAQPVWERDRFFDSALVAGAGLSATVEDHALGTVEMMGVPLRIASTPGRVAWPAPALGAHTEEVLGGVEAGEVPASIPQPSDAPTAPLPPLLDGVRALDLAGYIAGPATARHLALLGADVVKLEPPGGDPFRVLNLGFQGWNLGKRSIGVDLRSAGGTALLDRLVEGSDVLVEHFRPSARTRLGVDHERLAGINPALVHVSVSGYGETAAYRELPAFDPLLQALSGAMRAQGGDGEPVYSTVALTDVMTPLLATFGTCVALFRRARGRAVSPGERTGEHVHVSLVGAALAAQAAEFVRYPGAPPPQLGGRDFAGPSAAQRSYRLSTGHTLLIEATTAAQRRELIAIAGLTLDPQALLQPADGAAAEALARALRGRQLSEVAPRLQQARIPFVEVTPRRGVFELDAARANRLVSRTHHPIWGQVAAAGRLVRDPASGEPPLRRAPMFSEHAVEILGELGFGVLPARLPPDYHRLVEQGVVAVPRVDLPPEEVRDRVYPAGFGAALPVRQLYMVFNMDVG